MLVTLAPGADPNHVLQLLFERKTTVVNYYGKLGAYLDWALDTGRVTLPTAPGDSAPSRLPQIGHQVHRHDDNGSEQVRQQRMPEGDLADRCVRDLMPDTAKLIPTGERDIGEVAVGKRFPLAETDPAVPAREVQARVLQSETVLTTAHDRITTSTPSITVATPTASCRTGSDEGLHDSGQAGHRRAQHGGVRDTGPSLFLCQPSGPLRVAPPADPPHPDQQAADSDGPADEYRHLGKTDDHLQARREKATAEPDQQATPRQNPRRPAPPSPRCPAV